MITKSTFMDWCACSKCAWLARYEPHRLVAGQVSAFDRMLARDGYAVEVAVREWVSDWPDAGDCSFQVVFSDGQFEARADLVRTVADGGIDIFEIKSSSSVRRSGRDQLVDLTFQTVVARRSGHQVRGASIMHVDPDYVRGERLEPAALLVAVDVTREVTDMAAEVEDRMMEAAHHLSLADINRSGCDCRYRSAGSRCAAFAYLNPDIGPDSAHVLPRISAKRLQLLDGEGRLAIEDVRAADVTTHQLPILRAFHDGQPVIDQEGIKSFFQPLSWPLTFYDYETFASAVPIAPGLSPHRQLPVQFSAHVLHQDGRLEHHEHLSPAPALHEALVDALVAALPEDGSVIVWNESFEKTCNRRLCEHLPERRRFLEGLNYRTVDLMLPFRAPYVDRRFGGSASIKNVLPVVCPHLAYDQTAVHDGAGAMEAWLEMVETNDAGRRSDLDDQLRRYCALDSYAMVEIFRFLKSVVAAPGA